MCNWVEKHPFLESMQPGEFGKIENEIDIYVKKYYLNYGVVTPVMQLIFFL